MLGLVPFRRWDSGHSLHIQAYRAQLDMLRSAGFCGLSFRGYGQTAAGMREWSKLDGFTTKGRRNRPMSQSAIQNSGHARPRKQAVMAGGNDIQLPLGERLVLQSEKYPQITWFPASNANDGLTPVQQALSDTKSAGIVETIILASRAIDHLRA